MAQSPEISIIIPVLNEVHHIIPLIQSLQSGHNISIIVVDGGSQDGTLETLIAHQINVLSTPPGRGHQMNQGAKIATGDILLFLHADTTLPPDFDHWVRHTLENPQVVAGAFQLRINGPQSSLRWVETWVNYRSRWCQMPYGDQALFLKADQFQAIGGFPEIPIMEDFEIIRRLRPWGKIAIVPRPVITSGRRWHKLGVIKTTLINQIVVLAYLLGISPHRIVRWYRRDPQNHP